MDTTRVQQLLSQWHEAHRQDFVRLGYTNLLATFDTQEKKHMHIGAKYARLDVGSSGAWMLELATGIVYGIKGYGTPDKKKIAGDINNTAFDGAILFRDRFRRGRFDNRKMDVTAPTETVLYGIPKGLTERYEEVLLLTKATPEKIEKVKVLAAKDGFHSFRVATIDLSTPPDFSKVIGGGRR